MTTDPTPPPLPPLAERRKLRAPPGKFRVIGVDTFEGPFADYYIGDFISRQEAVDIAKLHGGSMNKTYVYDDNGREVSGGFGTY